MFVMDIQDEAHAIRLLNKRLVRLHREVWDRWQRAARAASFPKVHRCPRRPRLVGPLRIARLSR